MGEDFNTTQPLVGELDWNVPNGRLTCVLVCFFCVFLLFFRLSEVSPLVRGALEAPASLEHLDTLVKEPGLRGQDLLDLVRVFKRPPALTEAAKP